MAGRRADRLIAVLRRLVSVSALVLGAALVLLALGCGQSQDSPTPSTPSLGTPTTSIPEPGAPATGTPATATPTTGTPTTASPTTAIPQSARPASDPTLSQPDALDADLRYEHRKDGDSFAVVWHGQHTDIRLIGINCPEKGEPDAEQARAFTHQWMQGGPVGLEYDQERFDRYGRVLAYVWRDGEMLNLELARAGLCPPRYYRPNGAHRADLEAAWPR